MRIFRSWKGLASIRRKTSERLSQLVGSKCIGSVVAVPRGIFDISFCRFAECSGHTFSDEGSEDGMGRCAKELG